LISKKDTSINKRGGSGRQALNASAAGGVTVSGSEEAGLQNRNPFDYLIQ
jgi:hypothetical protein